MQTSPNKNEKKKTNCSICEPKISSEYLLLRYFPKLKVYICLNCCKNKEKVLDFASKKLSKKDLDLNDTCVNCRYSSNGCQNSIRLENILDHESLCIYKNSSALKKESPSKNLESTKKIIPQRPEKEEKDNEKLIKSPIKNNVTSNPFILNEENFSKMTGNKNATKSDKLNKSNEIKNSPFKNNTVKGEENKVEKDEKIQLPNVVPNDISNSNIKDIENTKNSNNFKLENDVQLNSANIKDFEKNQFESSGRNYISMDEHLKEIHKINDRIENIENSIKPTNYQEQFSSFEIHLFELYELIKEEYKEYFLSELKNIINFPQTFKGESLISKNIYSYLEGNGIFAVSHNEEETKGNSTISKEETNFSFNNSIINKNESYEKLESKLKNELQIEIKKSIELIKEDLFQKSLAYINNQFKQINEKNDTMLTNSSASEVLSVGKITINDSYERDIKNENQLKTSIEIDKFKSYGKSEKNDINMENFQTKFKEEINEQLKVLRSEMKSMLLENETMSNGLKDLINNTLILQMEKIAKINEPINELENIKSNIRNLEDKLVKVENTYIIDLKNKISGKTPEKEISKHTQNKNISPNQKHIPESNSIIQENENNNLIKGLRDKLNNIEDRIAKGEIQFLDEIGKINQENKLNKSEISKIQSLNNGILDTQKILKDKIKLIEKEISSNNLLNEENNIKMNFLFKNLFPEKCCMSCKSIFISDENQQQKDSLILADDKIDHEIKGNYKQISKLITKACFYCKNMICEKCNMDLENVSQNIPKISRCKECNEDVCNSCMIYLKDEEEYGIAKQYYCKNCAYELLKYALKGKKIQINFDLLNKKVWNFNDIINKQTNLFPVMNTIIKCSYNLKYLNICNCSFINLQNFIFFIEAIDNHQSLKVLYACGLPISSEKILEILDQNAEKISFLSSIYLSGTNFHIVKEVYQSITLRLHHYFLFKIIKNDENKSILPQRNIFLKYILSTPESFMLRSKNN